MKSLLKKWLSSKAPARGASDFIRGGTITYNCDGLATIHNCDFIRDPRFSRAYAEGKKTGSWADLDIYWRAYIACWAADQASRLEGDFVECGVNKGGMALTIMHYVDFNRLDKNFYLLDTFCGLAQECLTDEEKKTGRMELRYEECYEQVKATFKTFGHAVLIKGKVPDTLPQVKAQKVAYLSIDMNCVVPEIEAIRFFWDKIVKHGMVLLDDYGWKTCEPQKRAFDDFAAGVRVPILQLPTGQGLIIKP